MLFAILAQFTIDQSVLDLLERVGPFVFLGIVLAVVWATRQRSDINRDNAETKVFLMTNRELSEARRQLDVSNQERFSELNERITTLENILRQRETSLDTVTARLREAEGKLRQAEATLSDKEAQIVTLRKNQEGMAEQIKAILQTHEYDYQLRLRYEEELRQHGLADTGRIETLRREVSERLKQRQNNSPDVADEQ